MESTINKSMINVSLIELKGVYFVYYLLLSGSVVWIGSTRNVYKRLKEHKSTPSYHNQQYKFVMPFDSVKLVSFDSELNAKRFERYELNRIKPKYNIFGIDSFREPQLKSEPKLSINDKINIHSLLNRS
jgi:excinuclease UvrABC nuclease subunit